MTTRTRVLIAGAAGRDFHNFNLVYRGREEYEVVGFTATQIPNIEGRVYPAELAGDLYPDGIEVSRQLCRIDAALDVRDLRLSGRAGGRPLPRRYSYQRRGRAGGA